MKTIAQDGSGNPVIDTARHDFAVNSGVDAYGTVVSSAIKTYRGELQLDIERGIPYFETVFDSVNGIDIWKSEVHRRILEFPFVKSIDSFDASYSGGKLSYSISISTDGGVVNISQ